MNIAFWDNILCERGTTTSLYDYAYYNQLILKNKSFIFYDKTNPNNKQIVIDNFTRDFVVHGTNNFAEVDDYLSKYGITHIYIVKYGNIDNRISFVAKNCIHCVFECYQPHGDVYSSVSPWVKGNDGKYPVVPHMINLPDHDSHMREYLKIPDCAVVFGGYGGEDSFSIPFAQREVYNVASKNPQIYFLFANFKRFCPELPNIIHLPTITDPYEKTRFINTADAMLWARHDGETFGLAIGEFSSKNKPVIAMDIGDRCHVHILGKDKAFWYNDEESLQSILLNFNPETEKTKDWNAYRNFTPERVMEAFRAIYLE